MADYVKRGEYKIIKVDGTEVLYEEKPTLMAIYRAIDCECVDTVIHGDVAIVHDGDFA